MFGSSHVCWLCVCWMFVSKCISHLSFVQSSTSAFQVICRCMLFNTAPDCLVRVAKSHTSFTGSVGRLAVFSAAQRRIGHWSHGSGNLGRFGEMGCPFMRGFTSVFGTPAMYGRVLNSGFTILCFFFVNHKLPVRQAPETISVLWVSNA